MPFDLNLDNENRMMLISGPNAGGKSILMKKVSLEFLIKYLQILEISNPWKKI